MRAKRGHVLSEGPSWSGLYGPVLWLILFINLAARSWKEYSERIFSGCPYGDTTTRVSGPWLVAGIEWFRPLLGGCVDSTDNRTDHCVGP